jgi:hypothetical protein
MFKFFGGGISANGAKGQPTGPMTNFEARILATQIRDDGVETSTFVEVEFGLDGERTSVTVPIEELNDLAGLALRVVGARAIVVPGCGREWLKTAVQTLSGRIPTQHVYTHVGWREHKVYGRVYLHATGAIGAAGAIGDVAADLNESVARYRFERVPDGDDARRAVRRQLRLLELGPDEITVPLFGACFLAVLDRPDFGVYIEGQTGVFKSESAALAQQHFGRTMNRLGLPGSWSSTANALEDQAFVAADALLVVDDFAPTGTPYEVAKLHSIAERLFRGQGNSSGRGRLDRNARARPKRPPRGIILATGEDLPKGGSLQARLVIISVGPGSISPRRLKICQQRAKAGVYEEAMAAFIAHLAADPDQTREYRSQAIELRGSFQGGHRRHAVQVAALASACEVYLDYAVSIAAITARRRIDLADRVHAALRRVAAGQAEQNTASDPAQVFVESLSSAIISGRAHVTDRVGGKPRQPGSWGWRDDSGDDRPLGKRVGWIEGDDLYLDPNAAMAAAREVARDAGNDLTISSSTVWKRLKEAGFLAAIDHKRGTYKVRRSLEGSERSVLHLRASDVFVPAPDDPDDDEDDIPDDDGDDDIPDDDDEELSDP